MCTLGNTGSHENIIRFLTAVILDKDENKIQKLTNSIDGTLEDYVHDRIDFPRNEDSDLLLCVELLHQTAQGLKFLHDQNIVLGNIHSSNVFLKQKNSRTVAKLGAISCSATNSSECLPEFHFPEDQDFTTHYIPKEYREKKEWSKSSDVFAFGYLIRYTLSNKDNKQDASVKSDQSIKKPLSEQLSFSDKEEPKVTAADLIKKMVDDDPEKRLKIEDVIHHPAFYSSKKKLDFLLKVQISLDKILSKGEKKWNSNEEGTNTQQDHFEEKLKNEIMRSVSGFEFDSKIIFENYGYFTRKQIDKKFKAIWNEHLRDCMNIATLKGLLKAFRNKVTHACDNTHMPVQFLKDFEIKNDSYNPEKFVEIFITNCYPALLVILYNCYKESGTGYAADFYPKPCKRLRLD